MKTQGVQIFFVVYDILPVIAPHFFEKNLSEIFLKWIETVVQYSDGAICISRAVEAELKTWIAQHDKRRSEQFLLSSFHLGADLEASLPEKLDVKLEPMLQSALDHQVCFLMVGTVEPRKGHEYALNAFEALWEAGHDIALIIVGGQGWKTEALIKRIEQHPENKKRLFWLRGIDDDTLQDLYVRSKCLLMTSWGEGFGLPLIEAARFKLPIIARQLPVFEEIGGEHVFYFDGLDPSVLVERIEQWLRLYSERQIPDSGKIEWLTWKDSAEMLCIALDNLIKT
jgi:glycosyltransferase involved in cell wall biosynthesis